MDIVALKELAKELDMDRSHIRKYVLSMGIVPIKMRTPGSKSQLTLVVTSDDAKSIRKARKDVGYAATKPVRREKIQEDGEFYIVQLEPKLYPKRVKVGFAADTKARLDDYRVSSPNAEILNTWPCKRSWEAAAIAAICQGVIGISLVGGEVYDVEDMIALRKRASLFFSMFI